MRIVITFSVVGKNIGELRSKARDTYRELLDDPAAAIPASATVEVAPDTVVENGEGRQVATQWLGQVNVVLHEEEGAA